ENACEITVTASPSVQPPATPWTSTRLPAATLDGVTARATSTALVLRLTSSPLATTVARPTSPRFVARDALSTYARPRRSMAQRHAVPALDQYTLLPLTCSVLSSVAHAVQVPCSGDTSHT